MYVPQVVSVVLPSVGGQYQYKYPILDASKTFTSDYLPHTLLQHTENVTQNKSNVHLDIISACKPVGKLLSKRNS